MFMIFTILFEHNTILWFDQHFENEEMDYQTWLKKLTTLAYTK